MCLFKNQKYHPHNRPLVAKKDIVCYKKLQLMPLSEEYITPYTDSKVPTECLKNKVPFKAVILNTSKFIWKHVLGFHNEVTDGFIHSLIYLPKNSFILTTFKCIIPKGTKYFVGTNGDYASEQIIFVEQLK